MVDWRSHPEQVFAAQPSAPPLGRNRAIPTDQAIGSVEEAVAWVDKWAHAADETIERIRAVSEVVSQVTATASSARGEVEVTVGASGELVKLQLDSEVSRWNVDELAAEILRVANEARSQLGSAAAAAVHAARFDDADVAAVVDSFASNAAAPAHAAFSADPDPWAGSR